MIRAHALHDTTGRSGFSVELLESRMLLSSFVVTTAADSGDGSLRQAMQFADATTGASTISFAIPGKGVHSIGLLSPLPVITVPLTIDGTTEPGYAGTPLIELNGAAAGPGANGLQFGVAGASFSFAGTAKGLIINRFSDNGIVFQQPGAALSAVQGCYIGTDATGMAAAPNRGNGVVARGDNLIIGGTTPAARNVISGNGLSGVLMTGYAQISGNYIGTNAAGTAAVGNGYYGIDIESNAEPEIGGITPGSGNVISGNGASGIFVNSPNGSVRIQGNLIGTDAFGTGRAGNGASPYAPHRDGITGGGGIGGDQPSARNVISGNYGAGVSINFLASLAGNYIGTDISGNSPLGNLGDGVVCLGGTSLGDSKVGNVISANGHDGVLVFEPAVCSFSAERIGTNAAGTSRLGNAANGIESRGGHVVSGAATQPALRNVVSNNGGDGVLLWPSNVQNPISPTQISGMYIGVDATGAIPMGNAMNGVEIHLSNIRVGIPAPAGGGNVISANGGDGILIVGSQTISQQFGNNNTIQANLIGTDAAGDNTLGFGNGHDGIAIINSSNNTVGNETAATQAATGIGGNVIAFNRHNGVTVIAPTVPFRPPIGVGNLIAGNSIHDNAALGIDLGDDGPTPNHVGQITAGPNRFQNFPLLTSAAVTGTQTIVQGTVNSTPPASFRVELFANDLPDPSGYGQGQRYLGFAMTTSNGTFMATLPAVAAGTFITATATDPQFDTSEFSPAIVVIDRVQPRVTAAAFDWQSARPSISFTFTKDVSASLSLSDLQVRGANGAGLTATQLNYDHSTNTATFLLSGPLADGNYTATLLGASVTDANGNQVVPNAADGNYDFGFFSLAGDVNHDGMVDFADLVILARHYGQAGSFADGDLNHDGRIDFADLAALGRAFGNAVMKP